ncbi:fimbrial protein [Yersinia mollaretii]|uniref:Fimbrial protein n=2 Tax=Yersinia mollaretii TaxID=33060 RepID=A0AA44HZK6_YERMO|nr:fimbrial protein [Yersinia mollaretii]
MKKSISKKAGLLFAMVAVGYVFVPSTAFADRICQLVPGKNITVNDNFYFLRNSTILDSMPLFDFNQYIAPWCATGGSIFHYEVRVNSNQHTNGTYPTSIQGLSIKYGLSPNQNCTQDPYNSLKGSCTMQKNTMTPLFFWPKISLQSTPDLVPTGSAHINPELTIYYHFDNEPEKMLGTLFSGNLNFTYKRYGCALETTTLNLPMGQVKSNQFNGVDSEAGSASSQIKLTCDPGTKYSITVNATNEPGHPNLIQLTQKPDAATGVGVKLILNNKHVELGRTQEMGTSANAGQNLQENININASYYQTQNRVTPGSADASATFTMTYQ